MKIRIVILTAIVALLGSVIHLQGFDRLNPVPQDLALAQSGEPDSPTWYTVEQGTTSGGGYRLTSLAWQVSGTASSEGYHLLEPMQTTLRGSGCCCTYLPLILCNFWQWP